MLRLVLAVCLAAAAAADSCCSAGDQEKVKATWNSFWDNSDSSATKVIFGKEVFTRLFALQPDSETVFKNVGVDNMDSPAFSSHMIRVLTGLDLVINLLGEDDALKAELVHLNGQHLKRDGLKAAYFDSMVDILHATLPQVVENYDGLAFKNCLKKAVGAISHDLP